MALTYKLEPMPTVAIPECAGECPHYEAGACKVMGTYCMSYWDACYWVRKAMESGEMDEEGNWL